MDATTLYWNYTLYDNVSYATIEGDSPRILAMKEANKILMITLLVLIMLAMGCVITIEDFKDTFRHPIGFIVGFVSQFAVMPLTGFCLAIALSLEAPFALGLLMIACSPGGSLSNLFTFWTDGDVCLSVCMTSFSTVAALGMMPLNLFIYSRRWTNEKAVIPYTNIVITLASILGPVMVGVLLRHFKKEWTIYITKVSSFFGLSAIVVSIILDGLINPGMFQSSWELWFSSILFPLLGFFFGYGASLLLRQPHLKCRTIAFETGSQNVALAMTLLMVTFDGDPLLYDMLAFPALFGIFVGVDALACVFVYRIWMRLSHRRKGENKIPQMDDEMDELHLPAKSKDISLSNVM